jgi:hypothetical protein
VDQANLDDAFVALTTHDQTAAHDQPATHHQPAAQRG